MQTGKVFIVMSTKNREKLLPKALDSILTQSYTNWELVIINDNSTDGTNRIIEEHVSKDKRISTIFTPPDRNYSTIKQDLFFGTDCEFLAILDDDDWWNRDYLKDCIRSLTSHTKVVMVFTDCINVEEGKRVFYRDTSKGYPFPDVLPSLTVFRTSAFKEVRGWDFETFNIENKYIHMEIDTYLKLKRIGIVIHIPRAQVFITISSNSMGSSRTLNLEGILRLMEKWKTELEPQKKVWSMLNSRVGIHTEECNLKGSEKYFLEAIKYYPWDIKPWVALVLAKISHKGFLKIYKKYREVTNK